MKLHFFFFFNHISLCGREKKWLVADYLCVTATEERQTLKPVSTQHGSKLFLLKPQCFYFHQVKFSGEGLCMSLYIALKIYVCELEGAGLKEHCQFYIKKKKIAYLSSVARNKLHWKQFCSEGICNPMFSIQSTAL